MMPALRGLERQRQVNLCESPALSQIDKQLAGDAEQMPRVGEDAILVPRLDRPALGL